MKFTYHEIFNTLQGEGRNTGRPCIFIRFSGCNLKCPWCDTDFSPKATASLDELLEKLSTFQEKSVIFTGGEPLLQPHLLTLAKALKSSGYWLGIETNGTIEPSTELRETLDFIATSPKFGVPLRLTSANEVRLVTADEITLEWCQTIRSQLPAEDYYLSPCDTGHGLQVHRAIQLLGMLNVNSPTPPWRLSLQTHKLAGIP
ncbi:MAG: 7-carboxy-7-deazaguanine synthase QueE [bacterium]|nr:7-carboxy-7-deazaguanine synthase QueE [bacterium]